MRQGVRRRDRGLRKTTKNQSSPVSTRVQPAEVDRTDIDRQNPFSLHQSAFQLESLLRLDGDVALTNGADAAARQGSGCHNISTFAAGDATCRAAVRGPARRVWLSRFALKIRAVSVCLLFTHVRASCSAYSECLRPAPPARRLRRYPSASRPPAPGMLAPHG